MSAHTIPAEKVYADSAHAGAAENREIEARPSVSMLDVAIILAGRKRFIFAVTAIACVVSVGMSFLLPKRYTATEVLLPPQQGSSMSAMLASQLGSLGGIAGLAGGSLGLKSPNDLYIGMMRSRTVEDGVIQRFGLMQEYHKKYLSDARKALEKRVSIDGSGKDGMIHISVEARDPNRAAQLANGYVAQLREMSDHLAITEASQRRLFFEQQLEQAKNNLANAEEAMKQTEQKTGLIQLDSQARALIETAAALRAQITAKEVQVESLKTYATSENPQVIQIQHELDELRSQLAKLGGSEKLSMDNTGLMLSKGQVPQAGLEYVRRLRDVRYYETIFDILARQFELAKLDEAKQGAVIQVVDAAVPPDKKSFPKRLWFAIGGLLAGVIVSVGTVLLQDGWERMQLDPESSIKYQRLRQALGIWKSPNQDDLRVR